ncbi:hypothetical protein [Streptomyces sp. SAS_275]|uniref:hypothetical protein n=1 Tax=Streptomyces sp. SAS_275 TaxID=3412746 RepID=UPI00403CC188
MYDADAFGVDCTKDASVLPGCYRSHGASIFQLSPSSQRPTITSNSAIVSSGQVRGGHRRLRVITVLSRG